MIDLLYRYRWYFAILWLSAVGAFLLYVFGVIRPLNAAPFALIFYVLDTKQFGPSVIRMLTKSGSLPPMKQSLWSSGNFASNEIYKLAIVFTLGFLLCIAFIFRTGRRACTHGRVSASSAVVPALICGTVLPVVLAAFYLDAGRRGFMRFHKVTEYSLGTDYLTLGTAPVMRLHVIAIIGTGLAMGAMGYYFLKQQRPPLTLIRIWSSLLLISVLISAIAITAVIFGIEEFFTFAINATLDNTAAADTQGATLSGQIQLLGQIPIPLLKTLTLFYCITALLLSSFGGLTLLFHRRHYLNLTGKPTCLKCGYDLRGSIADENGCRKCPECGAEVIKVEPALGI